MKNYHFLVFLAVSVLYGVTYVKTAQNNKLHAAACPNVLLLFYEEGWHGGVFKVMKNDNFLAFLVVCVLFPKLLSKVRGGLY